MSRPSRRLTWSGLPESSTPKRPYRDTLLVYAGFAIFIVVFAWLTGGDVRKAIPVALLAFVGASTWGVALWRRRLRREARERAEAGRRES
ncbi:MAG TPA: hypothetical protein VFB25_07235 [Gaiellaceae bacterium]|nr:hypothetical protein [Gaiellaceae bacterium]